MSDVVLVAPNRCVEGVARAIASKGHFGEISITVGAWGEGVSAYRQAATERTKIIISRGGTAVQLSEAYPDMPVIDLPISSYDWIRSIYEAKRYGSRIVAAGWRNIDISLPPDIMQLLMSAFNVELVKEIVESTEELVSGLERWRTEGFTVVTGGMTVCEIGRRAGLQDVLLKSGPESVTQALEEAKRIISLIQKEKEYNNRLSTIINSIGEGVIAIDQHGDVTCFNKNAENLLGISASSATGRNIDEILPNYGLTSYLKEKAASWGCVEKNGGITLASNKVPIIVDSRIVGVVATFQEVKKLQHIESNVRKKLAEKGHIARHTFDDIIGRSRTIKKVIDKAKKFAVNDSTIVITGETGCGKEIFAQSIHNFSHRWSGPFVAVNCAALPESLLESELFGYEDGAFTGARKGGKIGLFEQAHQGTIFLDEISEMPLSLQNRILRVLQEKEVMRIGASRVLPIDVRVIASTNRDLKEMVDKQLFRKDLFFRLNVLRLFIPSLSARKEDILMLLDHFLQQRTGKKWKLTADAEQLLVSLDWPGNVRQLENVAERLSVLSPAQTIRREDLVYALDDEFDRGSIRYSGNPGVLDHETINKIIKEVGGSKTKAAQKLGISRTTLWRRLSQMKQ